jgi:hypothetical protein
MKSSLYLVPIALLCVILLINVEIQQAYAQATFTVITPTGGNLTSASDCSDISAGSDIIWLNCNSILYAISDSTNAVVANITSANIVRHESCVIGDCVIAHDNVGNDLIKYSLEGFTLLQTNVWSSPCDTDLELIYDTSGFIWQTCSSTDFIVQMNPNTFATNTVSQSLTAVCDSPNKVSYAPVDNIGVIHCQNGANPDTIVTFSRASSTSITILDTEVTTSGTIGVFIDGAHNTILAPDASNMFVWEYTDGGLLTLTQTIAGNTHDQCHLEPYSISASQELFSVCFGDVGVNTSIYGYMINSTEVFQIMSASIAYPEAGGMGLDLGDGTNSLPVWYISADTNDQRYIRIDGVRSLTDTDPEPPSPPDDGGDTAGVDCNDPANANILTCRLGGDGSLGGAGDFIVGDGSEGTGMSGIICAVGLVDCSEDDNMQTNGVGYILTVIALAVMVGVMWVASRGAIGDVPVWIWFIASLGIVGFATIAEWIDPTFLVLSIIVIVALATAKLRGIFGGDFK